MPRCGNLWHSAPVTAKRSAAVVASPRQDKPRIQGSLRVGPDRLEALAARVVTGGPRLRVPVAMPFTGEVLGEVPRCKPEDVPPGLRARLAGAGEWAETPLAERVKPFLRFHDLTPRAPGRDPRPHPARVPARPACTPSKRSSTRALVGRATTRCTRAELPRAGSGARAPCPGSPTPTSTASRRASSASIAPWNYPLILAISDAIPALLAGNAVVDQARPADAVHRALGASTCCDEAGLPEDLFQVSSPATARARPPAHRSTATTSPFTGSTAHRHAHRAPGRRAAHRLLARAGRQEPDDRPRRRRPRRGGRAARCAAASPAPASSASRSSASTSTSRSTTASWSGSSTRPRRCGSAPASTTPSTSARSSRPRSSQGRGARARRGQEGRHRGSRRPGTAGPRPLLLRADDPDRRDAGDDALRRRDLRPGGRGLPVRHRPRGRRARQRTRRYGLNASIWTRDTSQGPATRDAHRRPAR